MHLISLKGSYKQALSSQPCKTPVKAPRRSQVVGQVLALKGGKSIVFRNLGLRKGSLEERKRRRTEGALLDFLLF